ncbi:chromosome partitioning protein ParA [Vibrio albus]|uniref:Chromosome partitioning protein ParA n=1 Tax=Vibrio albus TaxID=2200953 RepID=A0A2U3BBF2_9VIBR|nr:chromosome partitioning protein ParA [Vibrio albus]PWI34121.1 chromosome partitioning protein ParA [Vibrio albus]
MKDQNDQDNVVVIEERDKRTYLYIAVAAVFGIAIGGLVGSIVTQSRWESAYHQVLARLEQVSTVPLTNSKPRVDEPALDIETEVNKRVTEQLESEVSVLQKEFDAELQASKNMVTELEKVNINLETRIKTQQEAIEQSRDENVQLQQKIEMQGVVFERARELFQKELRVKQELDKLQQEREELEPKVARYRKDCDAYLEGNDWDVAENSCDKHDEANSRISQIDQMIEVHRLDLREIQQIASEIGL